MTVLWHIQPAKWWRMAPAGMLSLLMGCATHRVAVPKPVFYPPPPEPPRLQFLTSYATANDVAPQSRFAAFIIGKAPTRPIFKPYGIACSRGQISRLRHGGERH